MTITLTEHQWRSVARNLGRKHRLHDAVRDLVYDAETFGVACAQAGEYGLDADDLAELDRIAAPTIEDAREFKAKFDKLFAAETKLT